MLLISLSSNSRIIMYKYNVHFVFINNCGCLQGLEIVNPQAAEKKVNEANAKYFSNTAGFLKVKKS